MISAAVRMGRPREFCRNSGMMTFIDSTSTPSRNIKIKPSTKFRSVKMLRVINGLSVVRLWARNI